MVESFRPVSFSEDDLLGEDKMSRLATNQRWLFERMPRTLYRAFGVRQSSNVKIASGIVAIAGRKKSTAVETVRFGDFFSNRCNPIVTTGIVSGHHRRIHVTLDGLGTLHPDHRGFNVHISMDNANKKKNTISRRFYVTWTATGY